MATQTKCPVCGMEVDPSTASSMTHQGQTYHFCSEGCRQKFQQDPQSYTDQA